MLTCFVCTPPWRQFDSDDDEDDEEFAVRKLPSISNSFKPKERLSLGSKSSKSAGGDPLRTKRRWTDEEVDNLKKGVTE
jgi:hypothetical protein